MKVILGIFGELLNVTLVLTGAAYARKVLVNFMRSGERYQPVVDPDHPFRSAGQLLVGAGGLPYSRSGHTGTTDRGDTC